MKNQNRKNTNVIFTNETKRNIKHAYWWEEATPTIHPLLDILEDDYNNNYKEIVQDTYKPLENVTKLVPDKYVKID